MHLKFDKLEVACEQAENFHISEFAYIIMITNNKAPPRPHNAHNDESQRFTQYHRFSQEKHHLSLRFIFLVYYLLTCYGKAYLQFSFLQIERKKVAKGTHADCQPHTMGEEVAGGSLFGKINFKCFMMI